MKNKLTRIKILSFLFVFVCVTIVNSGNVFAFDERFYRTNDIFFYNPDATDCGAGEAKATAVIDLSFDGNTKKIYDFLSTTTLSTNGNKPLTPAQVAGVMGNMYAESGFNPAAVEVTDRADKGHGLVQWTFSRWDALQAFAAESGGSWDNIDVQLNFLVKELQGAEKAVLFDREFSNATLPAVAAQRFRVVFERADPAVANDTKREGAAIAVFNTYSGSTAQQQSSCTLENGVVAGNIVKTAIGLALEKPVNEGVNKESDARDTYQAAKTTYNPGVHWTDCGGFIATIMISSGVDPNYTLVSTDAQELYVRSQPAKYQINESPTLNDLRPGDILFTPGHTTMYTGEATFPSVDASYYDPNTNTGGRVPSVRDSGSATWMINNGAISARVLK